MVPTRVADLVRRGAAGPAGREPRAEDREGPRSSSTSTCACPGSPEVFACGDAAAVPDLTRPGQVDGDDRPARAAAGRARGAQRRGVARARHGAAGTSTATSASSSTSAAGTRPPTRCACRSAGLPAKAVTRGYHLAAMPGNRIRTAADWAEHAVLGPQLQRLDLVQPERGPLDDPRPDVSGAGRGSWPGGGRCRGGWPTGARACRGTCAGELEIGPDGEGLCWAERGTLRWGGAAAGRPDVPAPGGPRTGGRCTSPTAARSTPGGRVSGSPTRAGPISTRAGHGRRPTGCVRSGTCAARPRTSAW